MTTFAATFPTHLPLIIQGGMGVGVSNWVLARAVAFRGQLGVVSGTCIDSVFIRRLQDGDVGGHVRRAMEHFPIPEVVESALRKYFLAEGRPHGIPYKALTMYRQKMPVARQQLTMLASFVEVWLAREGHEHPVGLNLLTKVQMPNLATLYGAMMAGVQYVLMGAGIPREIPGVLDAFASHQPATMKLDVEGPAVGETEYLSFDPAEHWPAPAGDLLRPRFLPIVSSHSLATNLSRKATGRVDGFIIEGPTAGGHNAPPRGTMQLNERGEPMYGERDMVDLDKMRDLGLPYWLAGGAGSPEGMANALASGAAGIQVGTLFAYTEESGVSPELRQRVLQGVLEGKVSVFTDPRASPTGYPFKVVHLEGATDFQSDRRERCCDLGYLRVAYRKEGGRLDYRCAAEPEGTWVAKGGEAGETVGRRCLCNALMANIGLGQLRENNVEEPPLLTSGDDLVAIGAFLAGRTRYSASDVVDYLLAGVPAALPA